LTSGPKPDVFNSYEKGSFMKKTASYSVTKQELPNIPSELIQEVERTFAKRKGPIISVKKSGKSFVYGTREFVV